MEKYFSVANAKLKAMDKIVHSLQQALANFKALSHKLHNCGYSCQTTLIAKGEGGGG